MTLAKALWRAFQRTYYLRLFRRQSYKDGVYGLAVAYFSGMYQIVSYLKYREMVLAARNTSSRSQ